MFYLITIPYFIANIYVYFRSNKLLPKNKIIHIIYFCIFLFLTIFPLFYFQTQGEIPLIANKIVFKIISSWLVLFIYPLSIILIIDFLLFLKLIPKTILNFFSNKKLLLFTIISLIIFTIGLYGNINYHRLKRVNVDLTLNKAIKQNLKIVFIADLQLGINISKKELINWITKINQENADVILLGGDIIDYGTKPLIIDNIDKELRKLKAKYGVYAVLGNHEYYSKIKDSKNFLKKSDINILQDQAILMNNDIYLVGRDDKTNSNRKKISQLIANLDKNKPIILIDHQPFNLNEAVENKIDIQLSGHTHSGQIWPYSQLISFIYENVHGLIKKGNTFIYVTSGIGIWGGKFRIGTNSEYVVINVHNK